MALMEDAKLRRLAGSFTIEDYPEGDKLIECMAEEVRQQLTTDPLSTIDHIVSAALAGLTRADVAGYISVGDEHEWAVLSIRAQARPRGEQL